MPVSKNFKNGCLSPGGGATGTCRPMAGRQDLSINFLFTDRPLGGEHEQQGRPVARPMGDRAVAQPMGDRRATECATEWVGHDWCSGLCSWNGHRRKTDSSFKSSLAGPTHRYMRSLKNAASVWNEKQNGGGAHAVAFLCYNISRNYGHKDTSDTVALYF